MRHEKSNDVYPQLQNSEEIEFQSLSNEAVCCTGITGVGTVDMSLNVLSNCPSFHLGDISLSGIDWMTDASHLNSYQNFMVDHHLMNMIDYTPSQYSTVENIATNPGGLRMGMQGAKMDDSKPELIGNFVSCGSRANLLCGAQDGKEMGSDNNLVDCVVQSDYPETLDGSFLTLGVGVNTEVRSKSNASSRDFISKIDGAIGTQLNPSHGQSGYRSSFSPEFRMAAGLSDSQTYAGGFSSIEENAVGLSSLKHNFGGVPSIVQNGGESSNASAFAGSVHNVDGCTLSEYDLGVAGSISSNFSSNPLQMLPMLQCHVPHPFLTPGDQKFGAGFTNIDPNQGFHGLSGVSSNIEHIRNQSGLPPNQSFRSLSGTSPIVHSSCQPGLPDQEQHRMAPQPSLSSFMTRKYATLASDQIQKCNMGSIPSFEWGTSVAYPVLGNIESTSSQYHSDLWQHYPAYQDAAIQTVENAPFSKRIELQLAAYVGQSQNKTPVQASNNLLVPAYTSGENEPAVNSNLLVRPSLKRKAAQPPAATPQVQMKRTRSVKPSIRSSTLYKAQNTSSVVPLPLLVSQAASVPSLAQPISSVPPVTVTARPFRPLAHKGPPPSLSHATPTYPPLVRTTRIPPSAKMSPPPHIKWKDTEHLPLSGQNCLLCKRDLSYTPEGPVFQPAAFPPVAVLSCGHCFHDLCLQQITPKDQANNPPCIPCVIGES